MIDWMHCLWEMVCGVGQDIMKVKNCVQYRQLKNVLSVLLNMLIKI